MPSKLDAVSRGDDLIAGGTTSGSESVAHPGSSLAQDVAAFLAVVLTTEVNLTAATFGAMWGATPMSLLSAASFWDSNKGMLAVYALEDPPPGGQTVTFSYNGVSGEVLPRNLMLIPSTYRGVESIGTPATAGGGATTSNSVAVASGPPAHRVVSWHGVGKLRGFTRDGHNQAKRQSVIMLGGGALMQQDAEGNSGSRTMTATHNASAANWAALAVDLAPAVVTGKVTIPLGLSLACSGGTYRTAPPGKFWEIPAGTPINEVR